MVPGVNDLSRSGGKSQTFFPSGPELICCLQNASTGHLLRTYLLQWTFFPKKRHFAPKLLFILCLLILSSLERIGLEKTMLNRSGINVISYDLSHSGRVHPACTLPCSKIVDHIYCPESERIRGAKINIWCPTLLSPVPGTTLSWPTPKNMLINASLIHTCKKREIPEIYLRNFFWIFRKILGWEREINTAPKPSPEVAPSKMEVAPSKMEVAPS